MTQHDRPSDHNISTDHQRSADAKRPSDTLDRPSEQVHPADAFDPTGDVGNAEPVESAG